MIWPRWYMLKKRKFITLAFVAAVLFFLYWLFSFVGGSDKDLLDKALKKTLASSSYRYSVEVRQGGREMVTLIEGERVEPNQVRIKGSMQKSQMEFIQIGDVTYMKDPWSDRWFTLKGNSLAQSELFMTEFNPMGMLNFKDVPVVKKLDTENINGRKTVVMELRPNVANPFLELKYVDFKYRVWVDPGDNLIKRVYIQGYMPGGSEGLVVEMKFWDFNEKIKIVPPTDKIDNN